MKHAATILLILASTMAIAQKATIVAYCPAPGQFVNTMPKIVDTADSVQAATTANKVIERGSAVHLGGFGGYVIASFGCDITSQTTDDFDFIINGNAFSGNAEPGVVWVSADDNGNGIPDDQWYELYGSEADRSTRQYSITYYKPSAADDAAETAIENYIKWEDNNGNTGYIPKNTFHKQSYYPIWNKSDKYTLYGTLLPNNATEETIAGGGKKWVLKAFDYGYADNHPNRNVEGCSFKIEWAKNADGSDVNLKAINFVKIQSGINSTNSDTGECSTEVSTIQAVRSTIPSGTENPTITHYFISDNTIHFESPISKAYIVNLNGQIITTHTNTQAIDFNTLHPGIYICLTPETSIKFVKQ